MKKVEKLKQNKNQEGTMIVYLLITIFIFSIAMVPLLNIIVYQIKALRATVNREQALQVAEAGINYYQWHLAHYPSDYQDGTGSPGPYVHDYYDRDTQELIGQFSLEITPPLTGSTITIIESTGWVNENPGVRRTVTVRYGIPSLAKYSILNNGEVWIYYSPQIFSGQVHSNSGVRFDVTGNAPIFSAKETYTTDCFGFCSITTKPGVWGSGNPNFWQFPVPAIDFSAFTSNLADMKSLAISGGIYLPPSNKQGYSLVFNSNGTVSVYKVKNRKSNPAGWTYDVNMNWVQITQYTDYKDRDFQFTRSLPSNGIIYAEDNIWVEGIVRGRATVAAATLPYNPSTAPMIYIPKNIVYSAKDGSDVLGLIGQKDIVPTYYASNYLEIDAAIISQNSSAQFYYYHGNIKNDLTIYGAIIEFGWWFDNFVWTSGINNNVIAGYRNTYYNYDANLLYSPPPSFPFSTSGYQQLDWKSN
jgi:hypothetical protein